ncbi:uncharacterized protein EI90DRAFT_3125556 [Cantharellus anzutake]|uniref:uncharacterized protein n=1 Tax=Cantharellus anzutake TaxID=1750568 RepID=UPI0019030BE0|nr:uncharacterized protein EI90DRAFT_3125556 [Cantharellus anzutake]KAF8328808.1 hypothetical protein EI90DRAFT_3125556 [Cantharellus anzutake]
MSNYSQVSDWSDARLEDDSGDDDRLAVVKLTERCRHRAAAKAAEEWEREEAEEVRRATEALKKRRKEEAVARKHKSIAMSTLSTSDWPPVCARCLKCHIKCVPGKEGLGKSSCAGCRDAKKRVRVEEEVEVESPQMEAIRQQTALMRDGVGWLAAISEQLRVHNTMMGSALASGSRRGSSNSAVDKVVMGDEEPEVGGRQAMVPEKEVGDEEPEVDVPVFILHVGMVPSS